MRNQYRFTDAPRGLRWRQVQLDNIALLPGDMLPYKETWERIADNLPAGSTLIVLPRPQSPQRPIYEIVARRMQARGKRVRLIGAEQVVR
jgi:hypothetical protein